MTTKKLNRMNKMSMEGRSPSHSRSSDVSFHTMNDSSISLEIKGIGVRLVVVEVMTEVVSRECSLLDRIRIQIFCFDA